jgi:hypothetical protein
MVMAAVSELSVAEQMEAITLAKQNGDWFPACGGTEIPFTSRSGIRMLYCWQPSTGSHAYLNLGTDMFMTAEESAAALNLY